MINTEELLKPVAADKACGEDLSYDPLFLELETLMKGKPETQFSAAEEPDWKKLKERCLELWKRSKDLRIATALAVAEVKTEGFPGFRDVMAILSGLVASHWAELYPQLDPADGNDPTQRVNIIASLAAPAGTFGDPLKVLERLREAPLANSRRLGRFSMADILRSQAGTPGPNNEPPASAAQLEAAFRDSDPDEIQAVEKSIAESAELVGKLDEQLTAAVGTGKAADLGPLKKELEEIHKRVVQYLPGAAVPAANGQDQDAGAQTGSQPAGKAITGDIQSREDVLRMLGKICRYYERHEPSSPVPYLLRRAQRLAAKNFMEIINDLSPDALEAITRITGPEPQEGESGRTEAAPAATEGNS